MFKKKNISLLIIVFVLTGIFPSIALPAEELLWELEEITFNENRFEEQYQHKLGRKGNWFPTKTSFTFSEDILILTSITPNGKHFVSKATVFPPQFIKTDKEFFVKTNVENIKNEQKYEVDEEDKDVGFVGRMNIDIDHCDDKGEPMIIKVIDLDTTDIIREDTKVSQLHKGNISFQSFQEPFEGFFKDTPKNNHRIVMNIYWASSYHGFSLEFICFYRLKQ